MRHLFQLISIIISIETQRRLCSVIGNNTVVDFYDGAKPGFLVDWFIAGSCPKLKISPNTFATRILSYRATDETLPSAQGANLVWGSKFARDCESAMHDRKQLGILGLNRHQIWLATSKSTCVE